MRRAAAVSKLPPRSCPDAGVRVGELARCTLAGWTAPFLPPRTATLPALESGACGAAAPSVFPTTGRSSNRCTSSLLEGVDTVFAAACLAGSVGAPTAACDFADSPVIAFASFADGSPPRTSNATALATATPATNHTTRSTCMSGKAAYKPARRSGELGGGGGRVDDARAGTAAKRAIGCTLSSEGTRAGLGMSGITSTSEITSVISCARNAGGTVTVEGGVDGLGCGNIRVWLPEARIGVDAVSSGGGTLDIVRGFGNAQRLLGRGAAAAVMDAGTRGGGGTLGEVCVLVRNTKLLSRTSSRVFVSWASRIASRSFRTVSNGTHVCMSSDHTSTLCGVRSRTQRSATHSVLSWTRRYHFSGLSPSASKWAVCEIWESWRVTGACSGGG